MGWRHNDRGPWGYASVAGRSRLRAVAGRLTLIAAALRSPNPPNMPQVLQYRGLPFEMRARGILNATGLSEGIVQARVWGGAEGGGDARGRLPWRRGLQTWQGRRCACSAASCARTHAPDPRDPVPPSPPHACLPFLPAPHPPQGPNFKTSTSPLSHESYLSRAVQAVFTGARRQGAAKVAGAGEAAAVAPSSAASQLAKPCRPPSRRPPPTRRQPHRGQGRGGAPVQALRPRSTASHSLCPPSQSPTNPPAGNHIEVKGVAAYQYTLAPASAAACNATAFEAWKAGAGFDEAAYQGECGGAGVGAWVARRTLAVHGSGRWCVLARLAALPQCRAAAGGRAPAGSPAALRPGAGAARRRPPALLPTPPPTRNCPSPSPATCSRARGAAVPQGRQPRRLLGAHAGPAGCAPRWAAQRPAASPPACRRLRRPPIPAPPAPAAGPHRHACCLPGICAPPTPPVHPPTPLVPTSPPSLHHPLHSPGRSLQRHRGGPPGRRLHARHAAGGAALHAPRARALRMGLLGCAGGGVWAAAVIAGGSAGRAVAALPHPGSLSNVRSDAAVPSCLPSVPTTPTRRDVCVPHAAHAAALLPGGRERGEHHGWGCGPGNERAAGRGAACCCATPASAPRPARRQRRAVCSQAGMRVDRRRGACSAPPPLWARRPALGALLQGPRLALRGRALHRLHHPGAQGAAVACCRACPGRSFVGGCVRRCCCSAGPSTGVSAQGTTRQWSSNSPPVHRLPLPPSPAGLPVQPAGAAQRRGVPRPVGGPGLGRGPAGGLHAPGRRLCDGWELGGRWGVMGVVRG